LPTICSWLPNLSLVSILILRSSECLSLDNPHSFGTARNHHERIESKQTPGPQACYQVKEWHVCFCFFYPNPHAYSATAAT
jgi:hypothetical protein